LERGILFLLIVAVLVGAVYGAYALLNKRTLSAQSAGSEENLSSARVTLAVTSIPNHLDIRTNSDRSAERVLIGNVYEGITSLNGKNEAVAGLAESWDVSKDALTYTFHLRPGLTFSNGDDLTSHDVVWSLQQLMTKKYVGHADLKKLKSATSTDDETVVLTLSSPAPDLLWVLAGRCGLVFDRNDAANLESSTVGSGPFTAAFSKGDAENGGKDGKSLTLTRNTNYWGQKSKVAAVTLTQTSDTAATVKSLTAGDLHGVIGISKAQATQLKKNSGVTTTEGDTTTRAVLYYNSDATSILSDKRFRQALRIGLDKSRIITAAGGLGTKLGGPIPALDPGYEDLTPVFSYDIAKSQSLRAYFLTRQIKLAVAPGINDAVVTSIVDQYTAQGLTVTATKLSAKEWKQQVETKRSFDMALTTVSGSHDLGDWMTGDNWWTFDSPDADELYEKAMQSTTAKSYEKGLAQAAKTLNEASPADWLYTEKIASAWSSKLSGMPTNLLDSRLPLSGLSLSET
jgi:peptide/nickel transport system substrate-binding protein